MANQATVRPRRNGAPLDGVFSEIGDLGSQVVTLSTLQVQLAAEDLRESSRRALPALVATAVFIPLGIASVTVGLSGLAHWTSQRYGWSLSESMLIVAGAGLALTGLAAFAAFQRLRSSLSSFRRSREELERNIAWLQTVLVQSGR